MRALLLLLLCAAALPSAAQPAGGQPSDAIGDILDTSVPRPKDTDEPDTAGKTPQVEPDPSPGLAIRPTAVPAAPIPYAPPPRSQLTAPVRVDETGKTPDGPPSVRDLAYDSRIRASFASAQSFQGPLEGGWMLSAEGGGDLYALQLVDRRDRLEGVWRDPRRKGALNASGLIDDIQRQGGELTLRFTPGPGAAQAVVVLHAGAAGGWSGDLTEGSGRRTVRLQRTGL